MFNRLRPARQVIAVAAVAAFLGATVGIAPAGAHVTASSENAVRGGYATVTFAVPNESEARSATTQLTITLPDVAAARAEAVPGWAATVDRDAAAGTVRSVTWTADPQGGIPADQFGLFRISVALPDTEVVSFPAVQTYADGTRVAWDQAPLPDGSEPEHPAPTLALAAGPPGHGGPHAVDVNPATGDAPHPPDSTARVLGGSALLLSAVAIGVAFARRRA